MESRRVPGNGYTPKGDGRMRTLIVSYGVGYGRHTMDVEVEDDATEEEIEREVEQAVIERLDWGWKDIDAPA